MGEWSPDLVLLLLNEFLQETVAFISGTCTRVNEINATFSSISRCLRVSSRTRRVVNLDFRNYLRSINSGEVLLFGV